MAGWVSRLFGGARTKSPASDVADPIGQALADREAEMVLEEAVGLTRSTAPEITPEELAVLAGRVSPKAYALIVRHETGGRDYYEKVYKARAVWPEGSSGLTIGFGYDLGYQSSPDAFKADWGGQLPPEHIEILARAVGLRTVAPDRQQKIDRIKALLSELRSAGVRIPWEPSEAVFQKVTMPRYASYTASALPGHEMLSADCFGALVSLTFNRGASYASEHKPGDTLDRYREMRGIKQALSERELERVPGLIRSMKRIWKGTAIETEMNRRRENEARLFEEGLVPVVIAQLEEQAAAAEAGEAAMPDTRGAGRAIRGIVETGINDEALEDRDLERVRRGPDFASEATRAAVKVRWAPDSESPDYAHLENTLGDNIRFTLRAADLAFLAELNAFPVEEGGDVPVLFGLRGCGIVEADEADFSSEVLLRDQRPDHYSTRCVIGVWDRAKGRIAVFPASTVPNSGYVTSWYRDRDIGNMLPTGFYRYMVGVHNGRPGCFVLRDPADPDRSRQVLVRRSSNNLMYDRLDVVDKCRPGDNLHPTFSSGQTDFNSAGCQVVLGQATTGSGNHRGPWAKFRLLAGLKTATGTPRKPYVYMMLTGLEALLASRARADDATAIPEVRQSLMRLRFGSKGEKVARLQKALNIAESGDFDVATAQKVYELQQETWQDVCDGIFTPTLDESLGTAVFAEKSPEPAVVTSETESLEEPTAV